MHSIDQVNNSNDTDINVENKNNIEELQNIVNNHIEFLLSDQYKYFNHPYHISKDKISLKELLELSNKMLHEEFHPNWDREITYRHNEIVKFLLNNKIMSIIEKEGREELLNKLSINDYKIISYINKNY